MIYEKRQNSCRRTMAFGNGGIAMVKLNILNMENFLQMVNACSGAVNLLHSDGRKENMNHQYGLQRELRKRFEENGDFLRLSLDIPGARDYMSIISYYVGNI